jgi:hypothetical protein
MMIRRHLQFSFSQKAEKIKTPDQGVYIIYIKSTWKLIVLNGFGNHIYGLM